jgi:hypothetical protein
MQEKNDKIFTCMNNPQRFMRTYIIFLKIVQFQRVGLELITQMNNHLTRKGLQVRISVLNGCLGVGVTRWMGIGVGVVAAVGVSGL